MNAIYSYGDKVWALNDDGQPMVAQVVGFDVHGTPRLGDIGEPQRRREYEPLPETEPIKEPAAPTPEREPEKVPS